MSRRTVAILLLVGVLITSALPALAGGWASVRVVSQEVDPDDPLHWTITVLVLQHDVTPLDTGVTAEFTLGETGATVSADGVATGTSGEYRLDIVFPVSGMWAWAATPVGFQRTSMSSIAAGPMTAGAFLEGTIWSGDCADLGSAIEVFNVIRSTHSGGTVVDTGVVPAFDFVVDELTKGSFAITITGTAAGETVKKCREIKVMSGSYVKITAPGDARDSEDWSLVASSDGGQAILMTVSQPVAPPVIVTISGNKGMLFSPVLVTVPAGTTVTWFNETAIAHTITATGPGFANSGMLDPGMLFSHTFTEPGTFEYFCEPHEWMTGVVVVSES